MGAWEEALPKMFSHSFISALLCAAVIEAVPTITFPINSQVPPVARISTLFDFTFSDSTFYSTLTLTYTLSNAPSWLSLDGASRTLSGTPPASAANTAPVIEITATDSTGSVTMNSTLVVAGDAAPTVVIPLEDQLPNFGTYSAPSSIIYYPSSAFTIKFDADTFSSSNLSYYAVTLDNTPLPSWIQFDGSTLTFVGETPNSASLVQPPQQFGVQLIASDVIGFAGVSLPFHIVVANHELAFDDAFIHVNTSVGETVSTPDLRSTLKLDDVTISATNFSSANSTAPSWLTFNDSTFQLTGNVSETASSVNVTITATDIYGDTTSAIVFVKVTNANHTIFSGTLDSFNATIGSSFSYDLKSALANPSDVSIAISESPTVSWLSLNTTSNVLSGDVPSSTQASTIKILVKASSKSTQATDSQTLTLNLVANSATTTSGSSTTSATSTPSSTTTAAAAATTGLTRGQLVAAILIPNLVLFAALLVCFCCYKRRRRAAARPSTPAKSDISNPMVVQVMEPKLANEHKHPALRSRDDFADANMDAAYMTSGKRASAFIRKSHTLATMMSTPASSHLQHNDFVKHRSFSETALSGAEGSWMSTQDGSFPTMASFAASSGRITRNFSRKTDVNPVVRPSSFDFPFRDSQKGKYRVSKSSIQRTPSMAYESDNFRFQARNSRNSRSLMSGSFGRRLSSIGHGSRLSHSSSFSSERRYSRGLAVGFGHGFGGPRESTGQSLGIARDSNSWQTIQTGLGKNTRPHSQMSALTESTDVLYSVGPATKSIKLVPKSPGANTFASNRLSTDSRSLHSSTHQYNPNNPYARPISRRAPSESPFFGGSSRASSRAGSNKSPNLRHIKKPSVIPAVPEAADTNESLERSILAGLRDIPSTPSPQPLPPSRSPLRDSLGITYGNARDATGHLRGLVKSWTKRLSRQSQTTGQAGKRDTYNEKDARYLGVGNSPGTPYTNATSNQSPRSDLDQENMRIRESLQSRLRPSIDYSDIGFDDDFYDRESLASLRDSRGNIIQYELDESPELGQAVARPSLSKPFRSYATASSGRGNERESDSPNTISMRAKETFMAGPGKRPISVNDENDQENRRGLRKQTSFVASQFEDIEEHEGLRIGGLSASGSFDSGPAFL